MTPLLWAYENNNIELVKLLIKSRANVNVPNKYGETPLHLACENKNLEIVKLLIKNGANINKDDNNNVLHYACENNNLEIVKLLIENGTDEDINPVDDNHNYPINIASYHGHSDIVEYLIDKNANLNNIDLDYDLPLFSTLENNNLKLAELLIERGADVNKSLCRASLTCNLNIIKYLVSKGANINAKDNNYDTPLNNACENNNLETSKLLIENGANLNDTNSNILAVKDSFPEYFENSEKLNKELNKLKNELKTKKKEDIIAKIKELIRKELTPVYDKQTAVDKLIELYNANTYQDKIMTNEIKELMTFIPFNHRFFKLKHCVSFMHRRQTQKILDCFGATLLEACVFYQKTNSLSKMLESYPAFYNEYISGYEMLKSLKGKEISKNSLENAIILARKTSNKKLYRTFLNKALLLHACKDGFFKKDTYVKVKTKKDGCKKRRKKKAKYAYVPPEIISKIASYFQDKKMFLVPKTKKENLTYKTR